MGTLHVVSTPIGNLEDVTLRALRILGEAEIVFAEDTRRTRILLDRHEIRASMRSLHAHNEAARVDQALAALASERAVALVCDAGTPLISDPGERLVAAAIEAGHRVEAVPGASAVLAALAVSGLPTEPFVFLGFPPRRASRRRVLFESYRGRPETLVLYESPNRVAATLAALRDVLGARRACLARELTKLHEEVVREPLPELAERYAGGARGEVTLIVEGDRSAKAVSSLTPDDVDSEIRRLSSEGRPSREIAASLAERTGRSRRDLYARVVELRADASPVDGESAAS